MGFILDYIEGLKCSYSSSTTYPYTTEPCQTRVSLLSWQVVLHVGEGEEKSDDDGFLRWLGGMWVGSDAGDRPRSSGDQSSAVRKTILVGYMACEMQVQHTDASRTCIINYTYHEGHKTPINEVVLDVDEEACGVWIELIHQDHQL